MAAAVTTGGGGDRAGGAGHAERADRYELAVVGLLAAVSTLPLWLARFPVAQDLPAHIETAAQIRALVAGDPTISAKYVLHGLPWPNALPTLLLAALTDVVDGLVAARVLIAVGVAAWPVALALLLRRLGRPALLAVLAVPTAFDLSFAYGFIHFVVGKPLWVLTLVATIDVVRSTPAPRSSGAVAWRDAWLPMVRAGLPAAGLAALFVALFCTHLLLFATAVPLSAALIVAVRAGWSGRLVAAAGVVAGALPAVWWWLVAQPPPTPGGGYAFRAPFQAVQQLWSNGGDLHPGASDVVPWVLCACGLAWACLDATPGTATRRQTGVVVLLFAGVGAFALLGPVRTPHVSVVAERFTSLTVALAVGLSARVPSARARRVVVAVAFVAVASLVVDVTRHWRAFAAEDMGDFDGLLARVPPGSRVATHYVTPFSPHGNHNAAWHWPKLVALRGSSTDDSFAWRSTCVVGLRDGVRPPRHPRLVDDELSAWDFLLVRGASASADRTLARIALDLVVETGRWRLYRVVPSRTDAVDPRRSD
jgi:hypothetical protein